ncbi:ATP-binding cassette domain-containing protein [Sphingomonas sp. TREG-RG-20F-R18-01]|uniref:amino acid ABC transporter ATP-binding/permease protein n=1 Tax=Sphingomonas sp. TREG-RG-20F-R18-01 TaxID=2914982 RepID=UPI001F5909B2|nr:ATP-binding cassette domain-containing protein [Sphingomonas sp. TREG-RG-20F-R18-01]
MIPRSASPLATLLRAAARARRRDLDRAAACALALSVATVLLLGLSGWFLTAAALAAMTGAAHLFNYMLPAVGIRLLAIVRTGARYGERLNAHDAALGMLARIRPALFGAIAAAPPGRARALSTGEASARLVQDVAVIEASVVRRSAIWSLLGAILSSGALALVAGTATLFAVLTVLAATIAAAALMARRLGKPAAAVLLANGALKDRIARYGAAAAELRCYGMEDRATAEVAICSETLSAAQLARVDASSWLDVLLAIATALAASAAFVLAAPAGAAAAALAALAAAMGVDGIAPLIRDLGERAGVTTATARLDRLLRQSETRCARPRPPDPLALELWFADLGNATFDPGERIALVGPSGCGKTSLVETLLGLRPAARDRVCIGGVDITDIPASQARELFAFAPQDAHLIAGTVRDNLLLADPDASDAALWHALHDAALDICVAGLTDGLDAWIGENGARLSGGEKRRLSLARALLSAAPWLVLDEPTEGLDPQTEHAVLARIEARLDRTGQGVLVITHSPSVRRFCDSTAYMGGTAAADGLVPWPDLPQRAQLVGET